MATLTVTRKGSETNNTTASTEYAFTEVAQGELGPDGNRRLRDSVVFTDDAGKSVCLFKTEPNFDGSVIKIKE